MFIKLHCSNTHKLRHYVKHIHIDLFNHLQFKNINTGNVLIRSFYALPVRYVKS